MFDEEEKWLLQGDSPAFGAFYVLPVAIHEVGRTSMRGLSAYIGVTAATRELDAGHQQWWFCRLVLRFHVPSVFGSVRRLDMCLDWNTANWLEILWVRGTMSSSRHCLITMHLGARLCIRLPHPLSHVARPRHMLTALECITRAQVSLGETVITPGVQTLGKWCLR